MSHSVPPFNRPDARPSDAETDTFDIQIFAATDTETLEPVIDVSAGEDLLARPLDGDRNERITKATPKRLINQAIVILAALALAVVGFVAGAQVQKSYGASAGAAAAGGGGNPAALASGFAGRNGAQGGQGAAGAAGAQGGAQGGAGGGITGTVKLVDGSTIYVVTPDGSTVIVKTSGTTTVSAPGALKDLAAGSTVTVLGQNVAGTVTATSVTKTK